MMRNDFTDWLEYFFPSGPKRKRLRHNYTEQELKDLYEKTMKKLGQSHEGTTDAGDFVTPQKPKAPTKTDISPADKPKPETPIPTTAIPTTNQPREPPVSKNPKDQDIDMEDIPEEKNSSLAAASSGGTNKGHETGLSPWDGYLTFFPNSIVFKHRYIEKSNMQYVKTVEPDAVADLKINVLKLTSIESFFIPTENTSIQQKLTWLPYCKARWDYYHVMGCNYKLTIYPGPGKPKEQYAVYAVITAGNDTLPIKTQDATPRPLDARDWAYMGIHPKAIVENSYNEEGAAVSAYTVNYKSHYDEAQIIEGFYKPGTYNRNIADDDKAAIWTAKGVDKPLVEKLNFWCQPSLAMVGNGEPSGATTKNLDYTIEVEYLVQWKDLNDSYKYQRSGLSEFL